jgi:hypothetical protein
MERLRTLSGQGDERIPVLIEKEKGRLEKAYKLLEIYPQILYFDEPVTEVEYARSRQIRGVPRQHILTQELGEMLLRIDDSMTLADKNSLWGRYYSYRGGLFRVHDEDWQREAVGRPQEMEQYVRDYLSGLKTRMKKAMEAAPAASPAVTPSP